jgi:hypothetical protein
MKIEIPMTFLLAIAPGTGLNDGWLGPLRDSAVSAGASGMQAHKTSILPAGTDVIFLFRCRTL